jgi:replication factor C subunit 1
LRLLIRFTKLLQYNRKASLPFRRVQPRNLINCKNERSRLSQNPILPTKKNQVEDTRRSPRLSLADKAGGPEKGAGQYKPFVALSPKKAGPKATIPAPPQPKAKVTTPPPKPSPAPKTPSLPTTPSPSLKKGNSNYYKFKNRAPPALKGLKPLPEGQPNCLYGKYFLITGVLESLDREEAHELIQRYGGGICKSVTRKLTHAVIGVDAGEAKSAQLKERRIPQLNEDELFELIRTSKAGPANAPKPKSPARPRAPAAPAAVAITSAPAGEPDYLWTEKFKPQKVSELIGNAAPIARLQGWLRGFGSKSDKDGKAKRAVLLSGPPGIGKSSAAALVCRELGFEPIEFNASDTRSKKSLHEVVSELVNNTSIGQYYSAAKSSTSTTRRPCLVMDEVDGLSSSDRGGSGELILMIRKTKIPIICICNDRQSPKVRSLANYCLDLRFQRPTAVDVTDRLKFIARSMGSTLTDEAAQKLIISSQADIRQMITTLQTWCKRGSSMDATVAKKDIEVGPFDAVQRLFSSNSGLGLDDRMSLYFIDYSFVPLFIEENFVSVAPLYAREKAQGRADLQTLAHLECLAEAADSISDGDLLEQSIRRGQNWELLSSHAICSTVRPAWLVRGTLSSQVAFPTWLGRQSALNKKMRLLRELHIHMQKSAQGGNTDIAMDYLRPLRARLTQPLTKGEEGIDEVIETMDTYGLSREDWDSVLELTEYQSGGAAVLQTILSSTKTVFTRRFNATHMVSRDYHTAHRHADAREGRPERGQPAGREPRRCPARGGGVTVRPYSPQGGRRCRRCYHQGRQAHPPGEAQQEGSWRRREAYTAEVCGTQDQRKAINLYRFPQILQWGSRATRHLSMENVLRWKTRRLGRSVSPIRCWTKSETMKWAQVPAMYTVDLPAISVVSCQWDSCPGG